MHHFTMEHLVEYKLTGGTDVSNMPDFKETSLLTVSSFLMRVGVRFPVNWGLALIIHGVLLMKMIMIINCMKLHRNHIIRITMFYLLRTSMLA